MVRSHPAAAAEADARPGNAEDEAKDERISHAHLHIPAANPGSRAAVPDVWPCFFHFKDCIPLRYSAPNRWSKPMRTVLALVMIAVLSAPAFAQDNHVPRYGEEDKEKQQFERIIGGLAKQLRSTLDRKLGRYSVDLPVFPAR